jgi:polysaccharide biosynthesis protein PslH
VGFTRRRSNALSTSTHKPALFLSAEAPYPLHGGGAIRSASLLHYLARARDVDLIVFRQPGGPDPRTALPAGLARRASVIELPPTGRGNLMRAFRTARRLLRKVPPLTDRFSGFEKEIAQAIGGRRYGVAVVEHAWCAPYLDVVRQYCDEAVLDLHNVESALHRRCEQTEQGAAAFALRTFADAALRLEREWLPRYARVLTASEHDARMARAIAPRANVSVYPNAIPYCPAPPRAEEEVIIFTGNMEYHPNISAVRYFAREIWPCLKQQRPGLVWRLVGRNPQAVAEFCAGDPRVELRGPVPDAIAELARAKVAVVPLLAGSGTRFKLLEAWAAGTPVVSTTIGAEGFPARHEENVLLADSPADFSDAVSRLLACPGLSRRLAEAGRNLMEEEFTWEAAWRSLEC